MRPLIFLFAITIISCQKDDVTPGGHPRQDINSVIIANNCTLKIAVKPASDQINVLVFKNSTDWANKNNVIASAQTDIYGNVTFNNLYSQSYFIYAVNISNNTYITNQAFQTQELKNNSSVSETISLPY